MKYQFLYCFLFFGCFSMFFGQKTDTIVVSKNGDTQFSSIQEAITNTKAFPYEKIVIFIKNGIYKEKIKLHEWNTNLVLVGENRDKTIITFDDHFKKLNVGRNSTFFTPTLLVEANDTTLKNLTIENSSGDVGQAVALSITSSRVAVVNCKLLGNQDTLYASGEGKQYFKNCYIKGTTDFIFGSATALFENCEIFEKKDTYITAASTTENAEFGFVFQNCNIHGAENLTKVFLGRPWRIYAKTVYIQCNLAKQIIPEGWENWQKPEAEKTAYYAEYQNRGLGSNISKRVRWSHQLSKKEAAKFTKKNILEDEKSKKIWYENL